MKKFFGIIFIAFVLVAFSGVVSVYSAGTSDVVIPTSKSTSDKSGSGLIVCRGVDCTKWSQLIASIENLIKFIFRLAVVCATITIAYAGFLYLTANGDMGQVKKAHGMFWMVVKGFIIMLTAYLLVRLILTTLVADKSFILLE